MVDKNIPPRVNNELTDKIDELIKRGIFRNRNEGIREGIRQLIKKYDSQKDSTFKKAQLAQIIANYLELHYSEDLETIILFGSVAKGTDSEDSDTDILVLTRNKYSYTQKLHIVNQIVHLTHGLGYTISLQFETTQKYLERIKENFTFESNVAKDGKVLRRIIPSHVLKKIKENKEN